MIRLLFDPLGDWHYDLVLKVDALPSMAKVVDSYYLPGFLGEKEGEGTDETRREVALRYVEFVMGRITSINGQASFIPVDLRDQYIGGLLIGSARQGLLSVKYVWSDSIAGHAVNHWSDFAGIDWKQEREWELSQEAVLEGLKWSQHTISGSHE